MTNETDEKVELIDEQGNVIGTEWKSVCHEKGLLHKGAMIFVFKDCSYQELLFQKRGKNKVLSPGSLGFQGGHVDIGESFEAAARRELQEECFVDGELPEGLVFEKLFVDIRKSHLCNSQRSFFRVICSGPFSWDGVEVEDIFFLSIVEVYKKLEEDPDQFSPLTQMILRDYKEKIIEKKE